MKPSSKAYDIGLAIADAARNWSTFDEWWDNQTEEDLQRFVEELGEAALDKIVTIDDAA